jgi:lysozyme
MSDQLRAMLIRQEGLKLKPYRDSVGKLTIGVGHNLEDAGISEAAAYVILDEDIAVAASEAAKLPVFAGLDPVRQDVLIDMIFNMGLPRLRGFVNMLGALADNNWDEAAKQMLDSRWATQVGSRANELAQMIKSGEYA